MPEVRRSYWAQLPSEVRYSEELSSTAKLLYAELSALIGEDGYCWATNTYFAGVLGVSERTISRMISQMEASGFIRCEMATTDNGSERRIYAGAFFPGKGGLDKNVYTPPGGLDKIVEGGLDKNVHPNSSRLYIRDNTNPPIVPPEGGNARAGSKKGGRTVSTPTWEPECFERFWKAYPNGAGRKAAVRAWDKLKPDDELLKLMSQTLEKDMCSEQWRRGIIPHASTWLNSEPWNDDYSKIPGAHCQRSHGGGERTQEW